MGVERLHAVAVVDDDVVAVAAVVAHGRHDAAVAGDDVPAVMAVAVNVHTVVHPSHLAGDRMDALAVFAADVVAARNGPHQRAVGAAVSDIGLAALAAEREAAAAGVREGGDNKVR